MRLNDDLSRPIVLDLAAIDWSASPAKGVDRKMLYRLGDEVARATSVVRYAPGSVFPAHTHTGGEEILVLEGTFQDEHGDYPAGSYFRNPPGTAHRPASESGCIILVRLWQFRPGDSAQVVSRPGNDPFATRPLHDDGAERVWLEEVAPGATLTLPSAEVLVLAGELGGMAAQTWARLPQGLHAKAGPSGARLWVKIGAPADFLPLPGGAA